MPIVKGNINSAVVIKFWEKFSQKLSKRIVVVTD